jgi:uncharacterized protein (DUF2141 family)
MLLRKRPKVYAKPLFVFPTFNCLLTLFLSYLSILIQTAPFSLSIGLTGVAEAKGDVFIAVYGRPEDFMKTEKAHTLKKIPVTLSGRVDFILKELPAGNYAVSAYQDLNGNGKLDKNLVGIPTEPYGFSNNARPKFRAPNWNETRFELRADTQIEIKLEKW